MKLYNICNTANELELEGLSILFSYSIPVACYVKGKGYFRTKSKYSQTTSKHINAWIGDEPFTLVDQDFFNSLIERRINEVL